MPNNIPTILKYVAISATLFGLIAMYSGLVSRVESLEYEIIKVKRLHPSVDLLINKEEEIEGCVDKLQRSMEECCG